MHFLISAFPGWGILKDCPLYLTSDWCPGLISQSPWRVSKPVCGREWSIVSLAVHLLRWPDLAQSSWWQLEFVATVSQMSLQGLLVEPSCILLLSRWSFRFPWFLFCLPLEIPSLSSRLQAYLPEELLLALIWAGRWLIVPHQTGCAWTSVRHAWCHELRSPTAKVNLDMKKWPKHFQFVSRVSISSLPLVYCLHWKMFVSVLKIFVINCV